MRRKSMPGRMLLLSLALLLVPIARMTINHRLMPRMAEWMEKAVPPGADVRSWKY